MHDTGPVQVRRSLPLLTVVQHHLDEAITLRLTRSTLLTSPRATLDALARFDERIAAHLDGLAVAGEDASPLCDAALQPLSEGAAFAAAVHAIERRDRARLARLVTLSASRVEARRGIASACGWLKREQLQGVVASMLVSDDSASRVVGLTACAMHRIDPGIITGRWLDDRDAGVRARALRAVGELGCRESMPACLSALADDNEECRMWAAWSGVLVGDRGSALAALAGDCDTPLARAFSLSMQALSSEWAHRMLQGIARNPQRHRWLIKGAGIAGDPAYIPWLMAQMSTVATARLAGEAFSLITGADLSTLQLERTPPEQFESGPSMDPDDPDVEINPDEGLPWPDPGRIECWWDANQARFQRGTRYFMGARVTREHCFQVLRTGYQRQRILAAHYLCLLDPGTPLFNTSAPAWRQQRLLADLR
jgi:uncharacterized protein (TIGR02270 family)